MMAAFIAFFIIMAVCVVLSMRARVEIDRVKEFDRLASSFLNLHFNAIGFKGRATIVRGRASIDGKDAS
ncbi:hypothetical protein [Agrobacterium sp.]|uniref:hypothetical protein n=1 Tax=Agrobacterium sp. TaxID=361 RepID=UPI0025BCFD8B|nr:hypothetical protein [Agrobacterium sp.]MCD4661789.1 hypothetical protein [Agrobacterium sp.]